MPELGKKERLRNGEAVELKPGVWGRLDKTNRTLQLDSGKVLPISQADQADLFPESEKHLGVARRKEKIEKDIKGTFGGEFFHQLGQSASLGGAKDWANYITMSGDEYLQNRQAEQAVSQRISEESPWTSGAATVASFVPDLYATRGMSALKAAPLLSATSAGSNIVQNPGEEVKNALIAAGGGYLVDKTFGGLGKIATRRQASRELPLRQAEVEAQNISGREALMQSNLQQQERFALEKGRIQNENAARLHQHNLELQARQNRMIDAENKYKQSLDNANATKAERSRLNEEFSLAQKQYDQALQDMPRLQKQAQQEYSKQVYKGIEQVEKSFPKDSKIFTDQLGVNQFIEEAINSTGLAASKEAGQASRILRSIFKEGEILTPSEFGKKFRAIEDALQRSTPEVQQILSKYKKYLANKVPAILEDSISFSKIVPMMQKGIEKEIESILKQIPIGKSVENIAKSNLRQLFREITPENFVKKVQSGELNNLIKERILTVDDFLTGLGMSNMKSLKKEGMLQYALQGNNVEQQRSFLMNEIGKRLDSLVAKNELEIILASQKAEKASRDIRKTLGIAEEVSAPVAPTAPNLPGSPTSLPRPMTEPMPAKPSLVPEPNTPIPGKFNPQELPTLPAPQNLAESTGDFLERGIVGPQGVLGGKNNFTKLAGLGALKYGLGKAALPLEAGYLGLKGLTSPTAAGEAARLTFKQGGIGAIESWAQNYPSYRNGILESPQDRRSLAKEVEDSPDIPIEQKALIQSKINRGKNLQERL